MPKKKYERAPIVYYMVVPNLKKENVVSLVSCHTCYKLSTLCNVTINMCYFIFLFSKIIRNQVPLITRSPQLHINTFCNYRGYIQCYYFPVSKATANTQHVSCYELKICSYSRKSKNSNLEHKGFYYFSIKTVYILPYDLLLTKPVETTNEHVRKQKKTF